MVNKILCFTIIIVTGSIFHAFSFTLLADTSSPAVQSVPLSSLDLSLMTTGWGTIQKDKSIQGKPLTVAGQTFTQGIGSHARSVLHLDLHGQTRRFTARIGVDDETKGQGTIRCKIYADNKKVFDSGIIKGNDQPVPIELNLMGVRYMVLLVTDAGDGMHSDHIDWINPVFEYTGLLPTAIESAVGEKIILTPKPGPAPSINSPQVYGVRPGNSFLYRIPATGKRPMLFKALNLPSSMSFDAQTGIITGRSPKQGGDYKVTLIASNKFGKDQRAFKIVVGDKLALTPPMGWNSWYFHYNSVTEHHMRRAADIMISSGMADYGYMYVNIDQSWQKERDNEPYRDSKGAILANSKFPDIKGMVDYIHSKGLKAGLYTSPGPWTCGPYVGSYQHEEIDARKFAEWGFDFLKYDWCSYGKIAPNRSREELMKPYQKMGSILKKLDRDIIFNLCQYGMGNVWEWGGQVGGHCWRTTRDLGRGPNFYSIGLRNARLHEYAQPGQWNDPDYILIDSSLTGNEQYSYMSMWCLMASPLFFGKDMTKLDDFTLNVLCNAEVIEVDQDPLGRQAKIISLSEEQLVLAKKMSDGSLAVGLFNLGYVEIPVSVSWTALGIKGPQRVRDLWRQKDLEDHNHKYQTVLGCHGVKLIRIFAKGGGDQ